MNTGLAGGISPYTVRAEDGEVQVQKGVEEGRKATKHLGVFWGPGNQTRELLK